MLLDLDVLYNKYYSSEINNQVICQCLTIHHSMYPKICLPYFFVTCRPTALSDSSVPGLHLQHRAEELLRGLCEEANLSIRMKAIQVRRLGGESIVNVL